MTYSIWITSTCNMKCIYCYEGQEKMNLKMDVIMADHVMEFIHNHFYKIDDNKLDIGFHGGEPFLNYPIMLYIVKKMKEYYRNTDVSINFYTTTNATILNEEMLEFVVKNIPDITVSIDGDPETQNSMRPMKNGGKSYDIVIHNCLKILEQLPNIRVRMTVNSNNVRNLYNNVSHLVKLGFKIIVPALDIFDKQWDETTIEILEMQIRRLREVYSVCKDLSISIIDEAMLKLKNKGYCSGGKYSINIYTTGKLFPCMMVCGIEEFCIGDIWNGIDKIKRDRILEDSRKISPICKGCNAYLDCDGARCKLINKILTGDYYTPPAIQCAIEHLNYKMFS